MAHDPAIVWQNGIPRSTRYQDTYYSASGGLDESRLVFLQANRIAERLQTQDHLSVGELGFGTGLNFLATWQLWQSLPNAGRLTFVSTETALPDTRDLARAHQAFPEVAKLACELRTKLPHRAHGFHLLPFEQGAVRLLLLLGDANETLPHSDAALDAWYLDGFAPASNPELWSEPLFSLLAAHSAPGATIGTWCAAGAVRRALAAAGFEVERAPGHGKKRHRTVGYFAGAAKTPPLPPWERWPQPSFPRTVAVLGGGLAGCAAARSLAMRGCDVRIYERNPSLAEEASGNPAGLIQRPANHAPCPKNDWQQAAFTWAQAQLPTTSQHPAGIVLEPRTWCQQLAQAATVVPHWDGQLPEAEAIIDCRGLGTEGVPLRPVRGQLVILQGQPPPTPFCGDTYLVPTKTGAVLGATFQPDDRETEPRAVDRDDLLARFIAQFGPEPLAALTPAQDRVALRACTNDYLPVVGPLPCSDAFTLDFGPSLRHGRPHRDLPPASWRENRYVLTGLGSHGIASSLLAAEVLAAHLFAEPCPIPLPIRAAIQPARFLIRSLKRS